MPFPQHTGRVRDGSLNTLGLRTASTVWTAGAEGEGGAGGRGPAEAPAKGSEDYPKVAAPSTNPAPQILDFPSVVDNLRGFLSCSNRHLEAQPKRGPRLSRAAAGGVPPVPAGALEGVSRTRPADYSFVSSRAMTTRWIWFVPS